MTKNEYLLMTHDELSEMLDKLDTLQGLAYLSIPSKEADEISNALYEIIEVINNYQEKYDEQIEL